MTQMVEIEPPVPSAAVTRRPRSVTGSSRGQSRTAAWMILPAGALILVFVLVPIALTFGLAFTDAKLISPTGPRFVGVENFSRLFDDPVFWKSLRNTVIFAAVIVPVQAGLALGLALLVNVKMHGVTFFRTMYFLPVVTSMVVISLLWQFMYQQDGLINAVLARIGITGPDWLGNKDTALLAIIVMSIWQAVGFHMVIWLSGLQTIPGELYEAADLDGVSNRQKFLYVTWPGLRQTATFILVTITIAAFALFTQVQVMTQGGPLDSTSTVVFQAFRAGYTQQQTGYAAAIALVFFALVLAVNLIQRYLTREKDA